MKTYTSACKLVFILSFYYIITQHTHFRNIFGQTKQLDEIPPAIPTSPHSLTEGYRENIATHSCRQPTHISAASMKSYQGLDVGLSYILQSSV